MTRKIIREIQRLAPGATVETNGRNHLTVYLPGGGCVTVSNTPGDRCFLRIVAADVRRQMRKANRGEHHD